MLLPKDNTAILNLVNDMKLKLEQNNHKKHYSQQSLLYLIERLDEEVSELKEVYNYIVAKNCLGREAEDEVSELLLECADVANFAMMIHANAKTDYIFSEKTKIR